MVFIFIEEDVWIRNNPTELIIMMISYVGVPAAWKIPLLLPTQMAAPTHLLLHEKLY